MQEPTQKQLNDRWVGQDDRIACIVADIRAGVDWTRNLITRPDKTWTQLPLIETCSPQFNGDGLQCVRDLRGIGLKDCDLSQTEKLAGTCLDYCCLANVDFDGSSLIGASFRGSNMQNCSFYQVAMQFTDFRGARCMKVTFENAEMTNARLEAADLRDAVFVGTILRNITIKLEPWYGFMTPLSRRMWTQLGGAHQGPGVLSTLSDPGTDAHFSREHSKWQIRKLHPLLGGIWYMLSDCGLSPVRFVFWLIVIWLAFSLLYANFPLPTVLRGTIFENVLCGLSTGINWKETNFPGAILGPMCSQRRRNDGVWVQRLSSFCFRTADICLCVCASSSWYYYVRHVRHAFSG